MTNSSDTESDSPSGATMSDAAIANAAQSFSARERILAAALKLFVEQGYFNTNIPDLSRESKCSVGSIYHTFTNKEEIARELYDECLRSFREAIGASLNPKDGVEATVKQMVRAILEFSEVNHQLSRYIWLCRHNEFLGHMTKHPTMVGFDPLGRLLTKKLKDGIRGGKIAPLHANIIWSILFGVPLSYIRDWLDGYNTHPPTKVNDILAERCWRALQPE